MLYRLLKKPIGISRIDILFDIELQSKPVDFCYIPNLGFIYSTLNHLGLISFKGEVTEWVGRNDNFNYPSLCYCPKSDKIIAVNCNGKDIKSVNVKNKYIEDVIQGVVISKLNKFFTKINCLSTSCDVDNFDIYWTARDINRIFKYNPLRGEIDVIGDGKSRFSVSSDLRQCSFKLPNGVKYINDTIYVCDSGNNCIRTISLKNKISSILVGKPMVSGDIDGKDSLLSNPSHLKISNNILYFVDNQKLKQVSLSDKVVSTIKSFDKNIFIDISKDLYILESL